MGEVLGRTYAPLVMERKEPSSLNCTHRWVLGQPGNGIVPGRCRLCGAERDYPASLEDLDRWYASAELRTDFSDRSITTEDLLGTGAGGARPSQQAKAALLADSES